MDRINGVLLGLLVLSGAIFLRMSTGLYPYSGKRERRGGGGGGGYFI